MLSNQSGLLGNTGLECGRQGVNGNTGRPHRPPPQTNLTTHTCTYTHIHTTYKFVTLCSAIHNSTVK